MSFISAFDTNTSFLLIQIVDICYFSSVSSTLHTLWLFGEPNHKDFEGKSSLSKTQQSLALSEILWRIYIFWSRGKLVRIFNVNVTKHKVFVWGKQVIWIFLITTFLNVKDEHTSFKKHSVWIFFITIWHETVFYVYQKHFILIFCYLEGKWYICWNIRDLIEIHRIY